MLPPFSVLAMRSLTAPYGSYDEALRGRTVGALAAVGASERVADSRPALFWLDGGRAGVLPVPRAGGRCRGACASSTRVVPVARPQ